MAKVTLNPILEGLRGKVGDLVLKRYGDGTIISPKPTVTGEPTEGQVAHRDRLVDAIVYGTAGMADPEAKAFYDEATRARKSRSFAISTASSMMSTPKRLFRMMLRLMK